MPYILRCAYIYPHHRVHLGRGSCHCVDVGRWATEKPNQERPFWSRSHTGRGGVSGFPPKYSKHFRVRGPSPRRSFSYQELAHLAPVLSTRLFPRGPAFLSRCGTSKQPPSEPRRNREALGRHPRPNPLRQHPPRKQPHHVPHVPEVSVVRDQSLLVERQPREHVQLQVQRTRHGQPHPLRRLRWGQRPVHTARYGHMQRLAGARRRCLGRERTQARVRWRRIRVESGQDQYIEGVLYDAPSMSVCGVIKD